MNTGYFCKRMTDNCFQWRRQLTKRKIFLTGEENNISELYNNNLLQVIFSKYQVISLGPRNYHRDLHIAINDAVIDQKSDIAL